LMMINSCLDLAFHLQKTS